MTPRYRSTRACQADDFVCAVQNPARTNRKFRVPFFKNPFGIAPPSPASNYKPNVNALVHQLT